MKRLKKIKRQFLTVFLAFSLAVTGIIPGFGSEVSAMEDSNVDFGSDSEFKDAISSYTVSFYTGEGVQEIETQYIFENETVNKPEDPKKRGYKFIGWFLEGRDTAYDFETEVVTADITLIAKFEEITLYTEKVTDENGAETVYSYAVLDDGTVAVAGYEGELPQDLNLPSELAGAAVTEISDYAFLDSIIQNVTIPDTVKRIGEGAFQFSTLETIRIPDSVTSIGLVCFSGCKNLKSLRIPGSVEVAELQVGLECESLEELILCEGIKTIKWNAFEDCTKLEEVVIPASVTYIEGRAFAFTPALKEFKVKEESETYQAIDGCIYDKDGKTLVAVPGGKETLTFPEGVTTLAIGACVGNELISVVDIPMSVTSIEEEAFMYCKVLDDITVRNPKTRFGVWAFSRFNIFEGEDNSNRIIRACENSTAHTYARENGFAFEKMCDSYTVSFRSKEGTELAESQIVCEHQTIVKPEEPQKEGYKFIGWFLGESEIPFDFENEKITSDLTLIAKYITDEESSAEIRVECLAELKYNGEEQIPELRVYAGDTILKEGEDYRVSFKNHRNAYTLEEGDMGFDAGKAPLAIITLQGNYEGTKNVYFKIQSVDLMDASISVKELFAAYTGKKLTPLPEITWNGKKLTDSDFYIKEYKEGNTDLIGRANKVTKRHVTIVGMGNFSGERSLDFTIGKKNSQISMNKVRVTGWNKKVTWDSKKAASEEGITPSGFKVKYGKYTLEEGRDYTVHYENNHAAGTGVMFLKGTGIPNEDGYGCVGTKVIEFTIAGTPMKQVVVKGLPKSGYSYTGKEICPLSQSEITVNLKKNGSKVEKDAYEVSYKKNRNKGTAEMILTGNPKAGFTGSKKVTFKITPAKLDNNTYSVMINGSSADTEIALPYVAGGVVPEIEVINNATEEKLEAGVDYSVNYKNNKTVGEKTAKKAPTVVIKGKGNYTKSIESKFTILKRIVTDDVVLSVKDKELSTKKNGWKQQFKLLDINGKELKKSDYNKNVQYVIEQDGTVPKPTDKLLPGTVLKVTVTLQGKNYEGTVSTTYRIIGKGRDIGKAYFEIGNKRYTGVGVELTKDDILKAELKSNKEKITLQFGSDYTIKGYEKNISEGTAKVTFVGIGEFGGEKTVAFEIVK